jgi:hypothetical protein
MPTFVDLVAQVQDTLQTQHGGTGNTGGYAKERLILPYMNDTGGSLAVGTVVKLLGAYSDRRVTPTTTAQDQAVVGVVVGKYLTGAEPYGSFVASAPAHGETVAVCVAGRCRVLTVGSPTIGQYAYASSTSGKAAASAVALVGGIGRFDSTASGGEADVVLSGSAAGAPQQFYTINFLISAGGTAIPQLGNQGSVSIDAPGTIVSARMLAFGSGSAVVDIEKATYSGYPTTSSICASAKPTLSGASKSEDTTLSGWTTGLAAGDVLVFQLDSMSGIFVVTCALKVRRS